MRAQVYISCDCPLFDIHFCLSSPETFHMPHKVGTALKQRLHQSSTDHQPVARWQHSARARVLCCEQSLRNEKTSLEQPM